MGHRETVLRLNMLFFKNYSGPKDGCSCDWCAIYRELDPFPDHLSTLEVLQLAQSG